MGVWGENCWSGWRLPAAVGEKVKKGRMSSAVVASVAPALHGLIPRVALGKPRLAGWRPCYGVAQAAVEHQKATATLQSRCCV